MTRTDKHFDNSALIEPGSRRTGSSPARMASASLLLLGALTATARCQQTDTPLRASNVLERVGFDQRLGEIVPPDILLRDESGREVAIGSYFGKRPLILILVYFRCPMLCGEELEGLTRCLRAVGPSVGDTFDVLTVSFDPNESSELAAAKKESVLNAYDRPRGYSGWHFLTGSEDSIKRLTEAVGFRFSPIRGTNQFAHAAGIAVLAPNGLITRYFFGVNFPAKEVQAALDSASKLEVDAPASKLLMLCYVYDPATGKYTLAIMRITQILAGLTFLALVTGVGMMLLRDRRKRKLAAPAA